MPEGGHGSRVRTLVRGTYALTSRAAACRFAVKFAEDPPHEPGYPLRVRRHFDRRQ